MTTICADDLLRHESARPATERVAKAATAKRGHRPAATHNGPLDASAPTRYEDHERRSSTLGDLLGGQVFPRRF